MLAVSASFVMAGCGAPGPELPTGPEVVELDISGIHQGLQNGDFTCVDLVAAYLARIEAYDRQGPALHAIVTINPEAMTRAREADARLAASGLSPDRPLECVPMIVKDNYDTADLPTTAGSASLKDSLPPDDAFQVQKIREAGAIVLAKSNMAEFAFSAYESLGSVVPGHTRNPYDPYRVPAGSSGGTGAAVAASFGAVGLGTDTGNSIRGPSSHNALFGIRSTMGLTSRDGIVPLNLFRDVGGPMARTVEDGVRVFDVLAGPDPTDEATTGFEREADYLQYLDAGILADFRIGVVRQLSDTETADPEISALFEAALADLTELGATIVDPVRIEGLEAERSLWCNPFRAQLEAYLGSLGPNAPVTTLEELVDGGDFHPSIRPRLETALEVEGEPDEVCAEGQRTGCGTSGGSPRPSRGPGSRRPRLPNLEQPAAPAGRPDDSRRKQLVPALSAHRLPRGHRSHGLHPLRTSRRVAVPRARARRRRALSDLLRVRAGDPAPTTTDDDTAPPESITPAGAERRRTAERR